MKNEILLGIFVVVLFMVYVFALAYLSVIEGKASC